LILELKASPFFSVRQEEIGPSLPPQKPSPFFDSLKTSGDCAPLRDWMSNSFLLGEYLSEIPLPLFVSSTRPLPLMSSGERSPRSLRFARLQNRYRIPFSRSRRRHPFFSFSVRFQTRCPLMAGIRKSWLDSFATAHVSPFPFELRLLSARSSIKDLAMAFFFFPNTTIFRPLYVAPFVPGGQAGQEVPFWRSHACSPFFPFEQHSDANLAYPDRRPFATRYTRSLTEE